MLVQERMTKDVKCCHVHDSLAEVARVLWEHDCGSAPIVDELDHLQGMLTDRDLCMAAYTSGRNLHQISASEVMSRDVATVGPKESLRDAEKLMRARGVRRLPVLDEERRVVGLISCNDVCRAIDEVATKGSGQQEAVHFVRTLASISAPRTRVETTRSELAPEPTAILKPTAPVLPPTTPRIDPAKAHR